MKYIGKFKSINNQNYTVYIITNKSETVVKEIDLGESPFVSEMDTSDENIYKPVRYQSATVQVVTKNENDYMFNIYSGTPNNTNIRLYREDNDDTQTLVWAGFATPVIYNNGYTGVHELLEIEAIDGLSILQYYKYSSTEKSIKTFAEIITTLLQKCEVYDYFYFPQNLKLDSTSTTSLLNELYISEQNFFDEKDDDETDDDVAWTCQEVLEEICQFLGVVAVGNGSEVYFLDYDGIKNGYNKYWKYSIGSVNYTGYETNGETISITGDKYKSGDSTISLDNVYNKVSIKDDFYKFEGLIPDIFDGIINITKSSDPTLSSSTNVNEGMYGEVVGSNIGNDDKDNTNNNNTIVMLDRVYDPEEEEYTDYYAVFIKYFTNPYYKFYQYNGSSRSEVTSLNYTDTKTTHGAFIAKFGVKKLDKTYSYMEQWIRKIYGGELTLDDWLSRNEISSVNFEDYIVLLNPTSDNKHISNNNITNYPYFQTSTSDTTALFGGNNAYLVISGSYFFHYMDNDPYPIKDGVDISEGRYAMDAGQTYLLCQLQWGNQYWNGSSWTSSVSTFKLPYLKDDTSDGDRRADSCMFENLDFVNTVYWRIGTTEKGYLIPLPTNKIIGGLPLLTVYKPFDPNYHSSKSGDDEGQWYKHACVFLKNFKMKAIVGDPTFSGVNNTDTIYTNVIDNHNVSELEEIKFKICTNDGKNPNYSSVAYKNNNEYVFLDTIYNEGLTSNGVVNYNNSTNNGNLRAEEWLIYKLTNQYSNPKVRLQLGLRDYYHPTSLFTDKWLIGKKFIVDSQSIDYKMHISTITLVEKA